MNEERAHDAVEHLQAAVSELVAAGRAILDALDDSMSRSEPGPTLAALVETVTRAFTPPSDEGEDDGDDGDDADGGYEHIPVE